MHEAKLGDRVRIQYSRVSKPSATTAKPRTPKVLEFTVGSGEIIPSVSLGVMGMTPGDLKRIALQPQESEGTVPAGLTTQKSRQRSPKQSDRRVDKRPTAVGAASVRSRTLSVVETTPNPVSVELEITLVSLDSSANANKRKPQFDIGGEA